MKIYIDAMGGDNAPEAIVLGTVDALRKHPELEVVLGGVIAEIEPHLAEAGDVRSRITLDDAPEVITNHESPVMGVRKKTNSATVRGMLAVRNGEADGFVSAGSTGAASSSRATAAGPNRLSTMTRLRSTARNFFMSTPPPRIYV